MKKTVRRAALLRGLLALACSAGAACAIAAPTTPGDLLVTNLSAGTLTEYTRQGAVVQTFTIPRSDPNFADLRDVVQGSDGRIFMFNGTFTPWMTVLDPSTGSISNYSMPGWSTVNNVSYGGIAVSGSYVFVSDMFTYGGGEAGGIVRFDLSNGTASRFATNYGFEDLSIGLDGRLYADRQIFDPQTMTSLGTLQLPGAGDVRGTAVDASGNAYTASWEGVVSKYSASGTLLATLSLGRSLTDIDIDASGNLVIGSDDGSVYLSDSSLATYTSFKIAPGYFPTVHVAFAAAVPEPATWLMLPVGLFGLAAVARRRRR